MLGTLLLLTCAVIELASSQAISLSLKGATIPLNSVVRINDIGIVAESLICTTNYTKCCRSGDTGGAGAGAGAGSWYLPNGISTLGSDATPQGLDFYRSRDLQEVRLNRRNEATRPTGIFNCTIPIADGVFMSVLVGIYSSTTNNAIIGSVSFEVTTDASALVPIFNLMCTSSGGPVDSGQWIKGNDDIVSQMTPVLTDAVSATYQSTISSSSNGSHSCLFFIRDGVGSSLRNITSIYTVEAVEPPTNVEATSTTSSESIVVTWTSSVSTSPLVTEYRLFYSDGGVGGGVTNILVDSSSTEYTIASGQPTVVMIRAETNPSVGLPSNLVMVTVTSSGTDSVSTEGPTDSTATSSGTDSVSSEGPTDSPAVLFFMLGGMTYQIGESIPITDIGDGTSDSDPLLCVTTNVNTACCRTVNGGNIGEWHFPNGTIVPRKSGNEGAAFTRNGGPQTVFLNRRSDVMSPTGPYECRVPDSEGNEHVGIINLVDSTSTEATTDDEMTTMKPIDEVTTMTPEPEEIFVTVSSTSLVVGLTGSLDCSTNSTFDTLSWIDGAGNEVVTSTNMSTNPLSLTFNPVLDNITSMYTCRVANGDRMMNKSIEINPTIPSPALSISLSSNSTDGSTLAGSVLTLMCSVNESIAGLTNKPTIAWTRNGGEPVSPTNTIQTDTSVSSVLTLNPLSISHAGVYECTGSLETPLSQAAISDVELVETVSVKIPPPVVVVTMMSAPSALYAGSRSPLVLMCSVTLSGSVSTDVINLAISWRRERSGEALSNSTQRVTVSPTTISGSTFVSLLSLSPPSRSDSTFWCGGVASPISSLQNIVASARVDTSIMLAVRAPTPPIVSIQRSTSDPVLAGSTTFMLTCSVRLDDLLVSQPVIEWISPSGNIIQSGNNFSLSSDTESFLNLNFNLLRTSQGGRYVCRSNVTVDVAGVFVTGMTTEDVIITLAVPEPVFRPNRDTIFYERTPLNLTCTATIDSSVIDTAISVTITLDDVQSDNRVIVSEVDQRSGSRTILFRYLVATPDSRVYMCHVSVEPAGENTDYVRSSGIGSDMYNLSVVELPLPQIDLNNMVLPSPILGQPFTLTCRVSVIMDITTSSLNLQWTFPNGSTLNSPNTAVGGVSTSSLTIDSLTVSDAGLYTCMGSIVFSDPFLQRINSGSAQVRVQLPPPMLTIIPPSSPIAGTNIFIGCEAVLGTLFDSVENFTVQSSWLKGSTNLSSTTEDRIGVLPSVQTPPYASQLEFSPLGSAIMDGGTYTCVVQVIPHGNEFILRSEERSTYDIIIEDYPIFPLTLSYDQGSCDGRASITPILTLAGNTSSTKILEYEWRDPRSNAISSEPGAVYVSGEGVLQLQGIDTENNGNYTLMACLRIPVSGVERCSILRVPVSVNVPGNVSTLSCERNIANTQALSFRWSGPETNPSDAVQYLLTVLKYSQEGEGRDLVLTNLSTPFIQRVSRDEFNATVTEGLDMFIPYQVSVTPLNLDGCGRTSSINCFTQEGVPDNPPTSLMAKRRDEMSYTVTWQPLTVLEAKGLIQYVIYYQKFSSLSKRQTSSPLSERVDGSENSTVVTGLEENVEYTFAIATVNSNNESSERSEFVRDSSASTNTNTIIIVVVLVCSILLVVSVGVIVVVLLICRRNKLFKYSTHVNQEILYEVQTATIKMSDVPSPRKDKSPDLTMNEKWKETEAEIEESLGVHLSSEKLWDTKARPLFEVADSTKTIAIESFRNHVQLQHRERNKGFEMEYKELGFISDQPFKIAKLPLNIVKNRFGNIYSFDHSRVILDDLHGEEGSDYINATTIDGYNRPQCYIAAQGPLKNTIGDFWRMIWEKEVSSIVMLTNCVEAGRDKCKQYWSDDYGGEFQTPDALFFIRTTSITQRADYVVREFSLTNLTDNQKRPIITQYHFTSWPDHGVPKYYSILLDFIHQVQKGHNKDEGKPLLVHCSAGVGRTGTFLTLDSMLERIEAEKSVDVYNFVKKMRERRVLMVQTLSQYIFIHDALSDFITCGNTNISAPNMKTKLNLLNKVQPGKGQTGFHTQFELLESVCKEWREEDSSRALEDGNRKKNRYHDIVPYDLARIYLSLESNYINASFIDGYKQKRAYIATQGPLKNTVNDFWTMIQQTKSRVIVMLCKLTEDEEESCYPFWPVEKGVEKIYNGVKVELHSITQYEDFSVMNLEISNSKSSLSNERAITLYQYLKWPNNTSPNTGTLFEMMELISKSLSDDLSPLTVVCNNGVSRTGAFISIHAQLEKLKNEACVDIFQFVKLARLQVPRFVHDKIWYVYIHEALVDFVDKFDGYANFQDVV